MTPDIDAGGYVGVQISVTGASPNPPFWVQLGQGDLDFHVGVTLASPRTTHRVSGNSHFSVYLRDAPARIVGSRMRVFAFAGSGKILRISFCVCVRRACVYMCARVAFSNSVSCTRGLNLEKISQLNWEGDGRSVMQSG